MKSFVVVVTEENTYLVQAENEAQIRRWYHTEGASWAKQHGDLLECHDKIISVEPE